MCAVWLKDNGIMGTNLAELRSDINVKLYFVMVADASKLAVWLENPDRKKFMANWLIITYLFKRITLQPT